VLGGLEGGWKERMGYLVLSHMAASPVHVQVSLLIRPALHESRKSHFDRSR
jgi:hypothetical protein